MRATHGVTLLRCATTISTSREQRRAARAEAQAEAEAEEAEEALHLHKGKRATLDVPDSSPEQGQDRTIPRPFHLPPIFEVLPGTPDRFSRRSLLPCLTSDRWCRPVQLAAAPTRRHPSLGPRCRLPSSFVPLRSSSHSTNPSVGSSLLYIPSHTISFLVIFTYPPRVLARQPLRNASSSLVAGLCFSLLVLYTRTPPWHPHPLLGSARLPPQVLPMILSSLKV